MYEHPILDPSTQTIHAHTGNSSSSDSFFEVLLSLYFSSKVSFSFFKVLYFLFFSDKSSLAPIFSYFHLSDSSSCFDKNSLYKNLLFPISRIFLSSNTYLSYWGLSLMYTIPSALAGNSIPLFSFSSKYIRVCFFFIFSSPSICISLSLSVPIKFSPKLIT